MDVKAVERLGEPVARRLRTMERKLRTGSALCTIICYGIAHSSTLALAMNVSTIKFLLALVISVQDIKG